MQTTAEVKVVGGTMRLTQVEGDSLVVFRSALDASRGRAIDVSPAFQKFQPMWWENERTIFDAEGIPKWPALSPAYAIRKAKIAPGKTILRLTDRLYESLTSQAGDSIYEVSPRSLRMGTAVPYAAAHSSGTGRLPARPMVQLLPEYWQRLNGLVFEYIVDPFRQGGR